MFFCVKKAEIFVLKEMEKKKKKLYYTFSTI